VLGLAVFTLCGAWRVFIHNDVKKMPFFTTVVAPLTAYWLGEMTQTLRASPSTLWSWIRVPDESFDFKGGYYTSQEERVEEKRGNAWGRAGERGEWNGDAAF
jgi:hypothetical protein